jgi:hypothetical protein
MATKTQLQALLDQAREEIAALTQANSGSRDKKTTRGKGPTKLQKANKAAGRATNMRFACNACKWHCYHEAKKASHVCKAGGTVVKIKS